MDSKLIYIACRKLIGKVSWTKISNDSEWIYFGDGNNINKLLVYEIINNHFTESELLIAWTRQGSVQVNRIEINKSIDNILGYHDFSIWDNHLRKVIDFNLIGVLRIGKVIN